MKKPLITSNLEKSVDGFVQNSRHARHGLSDITVINFRQRDDQLPHLLRSRFVALQTCRQKSFRVTAHHRFQQFHYIRVFFDAEKHVDVVQELRTKKFFVELKCSF